MAQIRLMPQSLNHGPGWPSRTQHTSIRPGPGFRTLGPSRAGTPSWDVMNDDLRIPAGVPSPTQTRVLLQETVAKLIHFLVMRLLYFAGLRSGEVLRLHRGDELPDVRMLFVRATKSDKDRYVLLDPLTLQMLHEHARNVESGPLFPYSRGWLYTLIRDAANRLLRAQD